VFSGAKVAELRHTQFEPDRPGTSFLTSAIPGLHSALECRNLISSNSFAHRLGTGNSTLRLAPGPVGLKPELRQGRSEFIYKIYGCNLVICMMIKQDWMNFKLENYTNLRMKVAKWMTFNKMDEFDKPMDDKSQYG